MSFRARLTLFFVLIVVVPMIALGVVVVRIVSDSEHAKAVAQNRAGTAAALADFRSLAQDAARATRALARHPALAAALRTPAAGASSRWSPPAAAARRFDQALALLMIDVDDFKRVNDTYGHQQGDLVLREVAAVLRDCSREVDEPARYGGEELVVALQQTDLGGGEAIAERVRTAVEALELPRLDGRGTLRVTVSCGVAASSDGNPTALVAAADAALYAAKRAGKNRTMRADAAVAADAAG
jgi:diguanylate cyclase (GGDEF)-like protein